MVARLTRIIPLLFILAAVAIVAYFILAAVFSPTRAKEILLRAFTVINGLIIAFFAAASLYALMETNYIAVEIAWTFGAVGVIGIVVTLICRAVFLKNHPNWRFRPQKATVIDDPWWKKLLRRLLESFGFRL